MHCLPDKLFHTARYSREDPGVFEFNDMVMVEPIFCHCQFVWTSKPCMPVVPFHSGQYRSDSLSNVHLTTLAGYAVNSRHPRFQVVFHRMKETGGLPRQQGNTFNVVFGQHSAELAVCHLNMWKKSNRGGLPFQLGGFNCQVEGPLCLFDTVTIFPENGFGELSNLSWRLSLSQRALSVCTNIERIAIYWRYDDVSQGSGRGYCWYVFGRPYGPGNLSGLLYISITKKGRWPSLSVSMVNCIFL